MKKEWQKPQLVILTRGKPEEAVLTVCKIWASGGPASTEHCNWGATACWDIGSSYPLIPFGGVYPERSQRVQDRLLGFGPWESVKDASADSAQAGGLRTLPRKARGMKFLRLAQDKPPAHERGGPPHRHQ